MYVGDHNQRQGPDQAELGLVEREGKGRERGGTRYSSLEAKGTKGAGNQMVRLYRKDSPQSLGWRVQGRELYRRSLEQQGLRDAGRFTLMW